MIRESYSKLIVAFLTVMLICALLITGCSGAENGGGNSENNGSGDIDDGRDYYSHEALSKFHVSDMSGYAGLDGYDKELVFVDGEIMDIHNLLEEKATFVIFASFANCPWCNVVITEFNDAALEAGVKVINLNTRKNPSWENNLDMDNYHIFSEDFDEILEPDSEGIPHLYVPHAIFVKEGVVVYDYQGAIPEMGDNPEMELNEEQKEAIRDIYRTGFNLLK